MIDAITRVHPRIRYRQVKETVNVLLKVLLRTACDRLILVNVRAGRAAAVISVMVQLLPTQVGLCVPVAQ